MSNRENTQRDSSLLQKKCLVHQQYQPALSKAWGNIGRGKARVRQIRGSIFSHYRVMVNYHSVLSGLNASVVSLSGATYSHHVKCVPCLSIHRSYSSMLYSYRSSFSVDITAFHWHAYFVVGIKEWAGHIESKYGLSPDLGWNPTTYKALSRLHIPETRKHINGTNIKFQT